MNEQLIYLPEVDSTNRWAKEHYTEFGPLGAVYTTSQTGGRGRLGRSWENAAGRGLYFTAVVRLPLAQTETLPLFASLAVRGQLKQLYGVECAVKWPNDLLLGGKKLVGILCEGVCHAGEWGVVAGIGINLAQGAAYFARNALPHATSLTEQGVAVELERDPERLAQSLLDFGFDRQLGLFAREGFAPYRAEYKAACVNLGRTVTFEGGRGIARDIDEQGRLVVETETGAVRVFTGEVSVGGIYGQREV